MLIGKPVGTSPHSSALAQWPFPHARNRHSFRTSITRIGSSYWATLGSIRSPSVVRLCSEYSIPMLVHSARDQRNLEMRLQRECFGFSIPASRSATLTHNSGGLSWHVVRTSFHVLLVE